MMAEALASGLPVESVPGRQIQSFGVGQQEHPHSQALQNGNPYPALGVTTCMGMLQPTTAMREMQVQRTIWLDSQHSRWFDELHSQQETAWKQRGIGGVGD